MTISLTDHQWDAVKLGVQWFKDHEGSFSPGQSSLGHGQDFCMGGFAGTGKSTVLPHLVNDMGLNFSEVAFCAPTGKAAKVMTRKLRDFGIHQTATTIHKLIYMPRAERADTVKSQLDSAEKHLEWLISDGDSGNATSDEVLAVLDRKGVQQHIVDLTFELHRAMDSSQPGFTLRSPDDMPENIRLIVVDEGSMVGLEVAEDLSMMGLPIFVMGDPGQLPPVAAEVGFNLEQPDAFLTEIHRQAADNPIIRLATMTRNGEDLKVGDYGDGVRVVERRDDNVTLDLDREAMVLCGTHRKKWNLTKKIRTALGYTETGPGIGEPLMICRNNKKVASMVNGALFTCLDDHGDLQKGRASFTLNVADSEDGDKYMVQVTQGLFEEHIGRKRPYYSASAKDAFNANKQCVHMDFGHVLTCHKSQGSQWDEVVVHDESAAFRDDRYRWLYTAITRAAERLTIVQ